MNPPFLNGLAVFANKHALALAHASEGGKCNGVGKVTAGQPKAGGSEYLELHGAFSSTLRAPGAELLSKVWFPCRALAQERCFDPCFQKVLWVGTRLLRNCYHRDRTAWISCDKPT